jgi:hypothetical protein
MGCRLPLFWIVLCQGYPQITALAKPTARAKSARDDCDGAPPRSPAARTAVLPLGAMGAEAHRISRIQLGAAALACCEKFHVDLIRFSRLSDAPTGYPDI